MSPSSHYRMWRRFRILGLLVGSCCLILGLICCGLYLHYSSPLTTSDPLTVLTWRLTGASLSPGQFVSIHLMAVIVLAIVCWSAPSVTFRWFVHPHCPQCGARTQLTTETGVQYVCRNCGRCHDDGTMKRLSESAR